MSLSSFYILSSGLIASVFVMGFGIYSLSASAESIFPGSGLADKMASMVLSSIYLMAKNLVGIFIITVILTLLSEEILKSNECLPIISLIAGYLLGKDFTPSNTSKNENQSRDSIK
ncbi:hypothetical protein [Aquirufa nivalisilvae]